MKAINMSRFTEFCQSAKQYYNVNLKLYDTCGRQYISTEEPMSDEFITYLHEYLNERERDAIVSANRTTFTVVELKDE